MPIARSKPFSLRQLARCVVLLSTRLTIKVVQHGCVRRRGSGLRQPSVRSVSVDNCVERMGEKLTGFRTGESKSGNQELRETTEGRNADTVRAGRGHARIPQRSLGIRARGHAPSPHSRSKRCSDEATLKSMIDHIGSLSLRCNKYSGY